MEDKTLHWDEINPHTLLRTLLKNLWVIVLLCASAVMCFTSISRLIYKPQYTSTATLMVSAKDGTNAYNSLTTTQKHGIRVCGSVPKQCPTGKSAGKDAG